MSNPAKPGWPDPSALPFNLFGSAANPQPLTQGLTGGIDLLKQFWGTLPGGAALPGFLVPTMDVEELDKRIKDLRAAESWVEVNLNLLRGTIQGLEVQRNTIAAIQSFSAIADNAMANQPGAAGALPPGWPNFQASQANAAPPPAAPPAEPPAAAVAPADTAGPVAETPASNEPAGGLLAGLAANHWLGFMQEQFAKVAQAALATPTRAVDDPVIEASPGRKTSRKAIAKKTRRRAPAARKPAAP